VATNLTIERVRNLLDDGPGQTKAGRPARARYIKDTTPGFYLKVTGIGTGNFVYRYRQSGKLRELGLGSARQPGGVKVTDARSAAKAASVDRYEGRDPIARKRQLGARSTSEGAVNTFDQVAAHLISSKEQGWRNKKHRQQWQNTLDMYASPIIGNLDVASITVPDVRQVLEPIWQDKAETARRVRGRVEQVLDYATAMELRSGENPARLKVLRFVLPDQQSQVEHHPALAFEDAPAFMASLRAEEGFGARGLELLLLTGCRTQEVSAARWDEVDLESNTWTVPAVRMKGKPGKRKSHSVPLSSVAAKLLEGLPRLNEYVFPSTTKRRAGLPMDKDAMAATLRRMNRTDLTVHGMRSTFRTWAAEQRPDVPGDVAEACLAHTIADKVVKAYNRATFMEMRRELLESWAQYLESACEA